MQKGTEVSFSVHGKNTVHLLGFYENVQNVQNQDKKQVSQTQNAKRKEPTKKATPNKENGTTLKADIENNENEDELIESPQNKKAKTTSSTPKLQSPANQEKKSHGRRYELEFPTQFKIG